MFQVGDGDFYHVVPGLCQVMITTDVGRDDQVGCIPQGAVCRQGLRIRHIKGRSRKMAAEQCLPQVILDHRIAPAAVDEPGPGLHGSEQSGIVQMGSGRSPWQHAGHHICPAQYPGQIVQCPHFIRLGRNSPGMAPDTDYMGPQQLAQPPESFSDIAEPYHYYRSILQAGDHALVLPLVFFLVIMVQIQFLHHGQQQSQHVFRKGLPISAGAVGELYRFRQDARFAVGIGAGRVQLQPFQVLAARKQRRFYVAQDHFGFRQFFRIPAVIKFRPGRSRLQSFFI